MKKWICLALCLVLFASVTAFAEEPIEIEFFCVKEEVQDVYKDQIIPAFEAENPGIKVKLTYAADGETVLKTRISNQQVPDLMSVYPAEMTYRRLLDEGYIVDMTNEPFMSNVEQSMLDLAAYNGKQIGLPYTLSMYGIHYNVDIFNELGLEVPTTMDALIEVCAKLKEAGYDAFALPMSNGAKQMAERLIGAFDGNSYVDFQAVADGKMDIHDVKSLTALAHFFLAIKPYSTADALGMNTTAAHTDFINRKAAMRLYGSWYLATVKAADPDFNMGLFGIPSPITNDIHIPVNIDSGFAVSATTAYPEACMKFVEFLTRQDIATMYYNVDGNINMIKGVAYDKAEYMDVYNLIMEGKMVITQQNLWQQGANVRSGIAAASQALYADEDLEAFYQACYETIIENYE